jgi:hypothetical protein
MEYEAEREMELLEYGKVRHRLLNKVSGNIGILGRNR